MSSGTNFLGYFNSIDEVLAAYPNGGNEGDYLYVGSVVHNWNKYDMIWDAENYTETTEKELHSFEGEVDMHDDLHVGGSTIIYGDLRVKGRIYGVDICDCDSEEGEGEGGSGGGGVVFNIDIIESTDTTATPTDENVFSALASKKKFLDKQEGGTVLGAVDFKKPIVGSIQSRNYTNGEFGQGHKLSEDENNNSTLEIDYLKVRKKAEFNTLAINQITFTTGVTVFSNGGAEITNVEDVDGYYKCYYDNKNGQSYAGLVEGDLVRCQRFDAKNESVTKYYWRECKAVGENYFCLDKTVSDGDGIPEAGDNVVQFGNKNNSKRQSAIIVNPKDGGSVVVYSGIEGFSLTGKEYVGFGTNADGEAFLYALGKLYFGDRDGGQSITYEKREGDDTKKLYISGTIEAGSTGLSNFAEWSGVKDDIDKGSDALAYLLDDGLLTPSEALSFNNYCYTLLSESGDLLNEAENRYGVITTSDVYNQLSLRYSDFYRIYSWISNKLTEEPPAPVRKDAFLNDIDFVESLNYTHYSFENYRNTLVLAMNALRTAIDQLRNSSIETIKTQVDGKAETWYQSEDPKEAWNTKELKEQHIGDLWYNTNTQVISRWNGSGWQATNAPKEVFDKIDGKAQIFVSRPNPPYHVNDLWIIASTDTYIPDGCKAGEIAVCVATRTSGGFYKSDWEKKLSYTDNDTVATLIAEAKDHAKGLTDSLRESLQNQIDGKVDSYFSDNEPGGEDDPSLAWTDAEKEAHVNDTFTNTTTGKSWRWLKQGNEYKWVPIVDSSLAEALNKAGQALAAADGKMTVFVGNDLPNGYKVGDLWLRGNTYEIWVCISTGGGLNDWVIADASHAYTDQEINRLSNYIDQIKEQVDGKAETWYQSEDPKEDWNTKELKEQHIGDLWYNTDTQVISRWNGSGWQATNAPKEVFDKIDGKAQIFVSQPNPPYHVNDLWIIGESDSVKPTGCKEGEIAVCSTENTDPQGSFSVSHWTKKVNYANVTDYEYLKFALPAGDKTTIDGGLVLSSFIGVKNGEALVAALMNATRIIGQQLPFFAAGIQDATDIMSRSMLIIDRDGSILIQDAKNADEQDRRAIKLSQGDIRFLVGDKTALIQTPKEYAVNAIDDSLFGDFLNTQNSSQMGVPLINEAKWKPRSLQGAGSVDSTVINLGSAVLDQSYSKLSFGAGRITCSSNSQDRVTYSFKARLVVQTGVTKTKYEIGTSSGGAMTITVPNGVSSPKNSEVSIEVEVTATAQQGYQAGSEDLLGGVTITPNATVTFSGVATNIADDLDNVVFSNGFFFGKTSEQYAGLIIDDTEGATFEMRNNQGGLRLCKDGLYKWNGSSWTKL